MRSHPPRRNPACRQTGNGFALIVTLSLMVLLVILAIGMLGLSAVSLRTAALGSAQAEARANARLALALAIGDLQKHAGPDRAVTATSGILATPAEAVAKPNTTGVWESWWDFNPAAAPDYTAEKTGRFRNWLVSSADPEATRSRDFATDPWTGRTIGLVGSGSLGGTATDADKATAGLVPVSNDGQAGGSYAWHVADESVKARINLHRDPGLNTTLAEKRALLGGHRPDPAVIRTADGGLLDFLPSDRTPAEFADATVRAGRLISLSQAELLDQAEGKIRPLRHHLTPYSLGVMADVRGGGLKQDLSSVFETPGAASGALPAEFNNRRLYASTHGITGVSDPNWSALAGYYNSFHDLADPDTNPTHAIKPGTSSIDPVPQTYNPAPVIAKVDAIFSLVARPMTDVAWIDKTRFDYFVDLIYTPVVTLHNPYNVNLSFHKMEVTFNNMPIAFNFMLQPGGSGSFISKGVVPGFFEPLNTMYQIQTYRGQKKFVLNIADWADLEPLAVSDEINGPIVLKPGQTLVCGPGMKPTASFYRDTRAGYNGDAYNWHEDGSRGTGKITEKIKASPVFTPGIGFETTAVMIANTRPAAAMGSWCSYFMLRDQTPPKPSPLSTSNVTDRFYLEFKIQRPFYYPENLSQNSATLRTVDIEPTFAVTARLQATPDPSDGLVDFATLQFDYEDDSSLKGVFNDRTYRYPPTGSFIPTEVAAPGGVLYNAQAAFVHPFAIFSAYARTTNGGVYETGQRTRSGIDSPQVNLLRDGRLAGKPFLFHNPSRSNFTINLANEKPGVQAYEINFQPFLSKGDFQDYMDLDAANRVPALSGNTTTTGIKSGSYLELPSGPLQTIADFRRSNALTTFYLPHFVQPVGNSLLHPLMSPDRVIENNPVVSATPMLDHSVLANHALYDRFYFSTFATRGSTQPDSVFEQFMNGATPLASQGFQPYLPPGRTVAEAKAELFTSGRPNSDTYKTAAEFQMLRGPFNVNSTSVQAWKAMLASMSKTDVAILWARSGGLESVASSGAPVTPMSLMNGGAIDNAKSNTWNGYRELTEPELEKLAVEIVAEVRERGPFLSLSEFVNRRVGPAGPLTLRGALEAAIARAEINEEENAAFADSFINQVPITTDDVSDARLYAYTTPEATTGNPAAGAPGWVSQGDLLRILEPGATVRGDTFVVRTYGEVRDSGGNITARAYAEAVVQRVPEYVDPTDRPSLNAATDPAASPANKAFGRRMNVISFRWLSENEI